jgi:predicted patatin/cPLA2 family phospholipase
MIENAFRQSDTLSNSPLLSPTNTQPCQLALMVEGGGMRSMFSVGVLDSFLVLHFDPFNLYLGVSAGCMNLISHLADQYLRSYKVMMHSAKSGCLINGWKYLFGGHYIDLDWLGGACLEAHPLDTQKALKRIHNSGKQFLVVCTSFRNGCANYYNPNNDNIHNIIMGSCSIPLLYRNPVYIAGEQVVDGGISDPIPVKKAVQLGATDIIVIRTRKSDYRESESSLEKKIGCFVYKNKPELKQAIENIHHAYNRSIDFIENPPEGINIYQIASNVSLNANLVTTDPNLLEADYQLGRRLGDLFVQDWHRCSQQTLAADNGLPGLHSKANGLKNRFA